MQRLGNWLDRFTEWAWVKTEEDPIFLVVIALLFIFASAFPILILAAVIALFGMTGLIILVPVVIALVALDDWYTKIKKGRKD